MLQPFPQVDKNRLDDAAEAEMRWAMDFILGVRQIRSSMDIPPGKALPVLLQDGESDDPDKVRRFEQYLFTLAKLESIQWLAAGESAPESATALVGTLKIFIPMAGLIDKEKELARLDKQIAKLSADVTRSETKLANSNYVDRAPKEVVDGERQRLAEMGQKLQQLEDQRRRIEKM